MDSVKLSEQKQLKLQFDYPIAPSKSTSNFSSALTQLVRATVHFLTQGNELRIWQKVDRNGNVYWNVYDPITTHRARGLSEEQLRTWLEERYSR